MANLRVKDGAAADKYLKGTGDGTDISPFIPEHTETNSAAIAASLAALDNAVAGSELQVDVVTMPAVTVDGTVGISGIAAVSAASLPLPSGAATSARQDTANTALAAIQTAVQTLDDAISGAEMQVDVVSLPTVTVQATNLDIRNLTTADNVTATLSGLDKAALDSIQAAVEALDNAVAGNEIQVDIVSSALPTGAATAANQTAGNTALAAIQTAVEALDNAVSGNELQVDVLTLPALPAGDNNIGNVDVVSLPTVTIQRTPKSYSHVCTTVASSGDNSVIAAPGAGQRLVIADLIVQNESTVTTVAIVKSGANARWRSRAGENGGLALSFGADLEWRLGDNEALVVNLSGANSHSVSVRYFVEAV